MFSWLKRRRRRKLLLELFPDQWRPFLEGVRLYTQLSPKERGQLENALRIIVAEKHWEECGGMEITDEVKVVIAALAAIPLLNLRHDYYRNVMSILVYPDTFKVPNRSIRTAITLTILGMEQNTQNTKLHAWPAHLWGQNSTWAGPTARCG